MKIIIFLILIAFGILESESRTVYISSETGAISETPIQADQQLARMRRDVTSTDGMKNALWVTNPSWEGDSPLCADSVDAYYNEQTQQYTVPQWAVYSQHGGDQGSAELWIQIYDLQTFALYAHNQGVWVNPDDCQAIWDLTLRYIIVPLINNIHIQKRPTLNARDNGIAVYLMCKTVDASDWLVCSPDAYHAITHANVNIHTSKLRVYKQ